MRFVVDESVEMQIVDQLRGDGHDVLAIQEQAAGLEDERVLAASDAESRILISGDKDFGELVYRLGRASSGVVLVRLAGLSNALKATIVRDVVRSYGPEMLGSFVVIEPGRVRIRKRLTP